MTDNPLPLRVGRVGDVATLRFNRPDALNALDVPMAQAFLAAVRDIARDRSVRAVLLSGEGKAFMAGGDLAVLRADPSAAAAALIGPLHEALTVLEQIDAPVVAQVQGVAAGAGLSVMLQADLVLAAEGTRFNLAYANVGTSCDAGASWALPRWVGLRRALEIALLSETIDAAAAERIGLVNRLVAPERLEEEAIALAQRLAQGPTVALGNLRRLLRSSGECDLTTQLAAEAAAFQRCAVTADFRSGLEAFFAKKTPAFEGR